MRITEVHIKTRASYEEYPGELVGTVVLAGDTGKQELVLSSFAVGQIFSVIGGEIVETAKSNAGQVKAAVSEAINGPLLADKSTIKLGE